MSHSFDKKQKRQLMLLFALSGSAANIWRNEYLYRPSRDRLGVNVSARVLILSLKEPRHD
jgi:hypothetical protein